MNHDVQCCPMLSIAVLMRSILVLLSSPVLMLSMDRTFSSANGVCGTRTVRMKRDKKL